MTSILCGPVIEEDSTVSNPSKKPRRRSYDCRNSLISKENYIPKCSKCLKRKFKKHKLRKDFVDDQDVLNVSQILISSLNIKSPCKDKNSLELELEELRPKNYLSKMVRRKQNASKLLQVVIPGRKATLNSNKDEGSLPTNQEKKKTNAFKFLMDSRNKSIGTNSPGKERPITEGEIQEMIEKRNINAKRNLILHKMAEAKGALKNREIEENKEKIIKKKMDKRAEKLKSMLINKEPKAAKVDGQINGSNFNRSPLNSIDSDENNKLFDTDQNKKHVHPPDNTLQLINMFSDTNDISTYGKKKIISKEEHEFLNKLSPSLKKKESMLSYFKKVDKDEEHENTDNDNDVIKVKFTPKHKKKGKRKKSKQIKGTNFEVMETKSTPMGTVNEADNISVEISTAIEDKNHIVNQHEENKKIISKNDRKRKRDIKESTALNNEGKTSETLITYDNSRRKRTVKKPTKYNDFDTSSSDDDLVIFTPKKKKYSDKKCEINDIFKEQPIAKTSDTNKLKVKNEKIPNQTKKIENEVKQHKKSIKIAPIFTAKSQPDLIAIEAKQKFLKSGVPDQLKKIIAKQRERSVTCTNDFFKVVHIQQLNAVDNHTALNNFNIEELNSTIDITNVGWNTDLYQKLLNFTTENVSIFHLKLNNNVQVMLHNFKESYERFPVYRTFKLLRSKKKGELKVNVNYIDHDNSIEILNGSSIDGETVNPEQLTWSDKYKPLATNQIIGNFESIKELRKWLISWTENQKSNQITKSYESDLSDFCQSDADSRESTKTHNLLILSGPVGSGKTSSVYAIAAELSIKVIEVNSSSKRTGKIMLQDLQEATQSHKVNRGTGSSENSQKSQELALPGLKETKKKRGRPKKTDLTEKKVKKEKPEKLNVLPASQDTIRTAMSLILIDDADIVFEQDDGFCSAIVQLVNSSKRPVILITGSLDCSHLQRFMHGSKILKMNPLVPGMLGTWLDIMCLADSGTSFPGLGGKLLDFYKGDIRKTINCLQFYIGSQEQSLIENDCCSQNIDCFKDNDDELSNMSWIESKPKDSNMNNESYFLWKHFIRTQVDMNYKHPMHLLNVWWSLPKIISDNSNSRKEDETVERPKIKDQTSIESLHLVLDAISICDFFSFRNEGRESILSEPWYMSESDSVSEQENLDNYDVTHEINSEICYTLLKGSIAAAQEKTQCSNKYDLDFPGMTIQRQRDKIVSRHNTLTDSLNPQAILDRKALALDYWSSCRSLCRIEKTKTDTHYKRNNRYCHYLKSLSIYCKNDSYDYLADSLCPDHLKKQ